MNRRQLFFGVLAGATVAVLPKMRPGLPEIVTVQYDCRYNFKDDDDVCDYTLRGLKSYKCARGMANHILGSTL